LRRVAPKPDAQERDRRRRIVEELKQEYVNQLWIQNPGGPVPAVVQVPHAWMNDRLEEMGEDWRVE